MSRKAINPNHPVASPSSSFIMLAVNVANNYQGIFNSTSRTSRETRDGVFLCFIYLNQTRHREKYKRKNTICTIESPSCSSISTAVDMPNS